MRLQFWKRQPADETAPQPVPTVTRFNVSPRTDIGESGLPSDPEAASKIAALRRRRELLRNELNVAQSAAGPANKWSTEIDLISQAIAEIAGERDAVSSGKAHAGQMLDDIPVEDVTVTLEPSPKVSFRIGSEEFVYEEPAEWAERGYQMARVELELVSGNPTALVPPSLNDLARQSLTDHLTLSLFEFATDMRDRALAEEPLGHATLRDLARPAEEEGGWFDWLGNSPIRVAQDADRAGLDAEIDRLEVERTALATEQAKLAEEAPFVARRLAEVESAIAAAEGRSGANKV